MGINFSILLEASLPALGSSLQPGVEPQKTEFLVLYWKGTHYWHFHINRRVEPRWSNTRPPSWAKWMTNLASLLHQPHRLRCTQAAHGGLWEITPHSFTDLHLLGASVWRVVWGGLGVLRDPLLISHPWYLRVGEAGSGQPSPASFVSFLSSPANGILANHLHRYREEVSRDRHLISRKIGHDSSFYTHYCHSQDKYHHGFKFLSGKKNHLVFWGETILQQTLINFQILLADQFV